MRRDVVDKKGNLRPFVCSPVSLLTDINIVYLHIADGIAEHTLIYDYTNKLITVRVIDKDDIKNGYMDVVETFKRSPHEHLPKILNTIGDIHVMQEYYGDLYSYICYKKMLSEDIALNLFKQIVNIVMLMILR